MVTLITAGSPNTTAALKSIFFFWYCLITPTKAPNPTTNKEYPVASFSSNKKMYVKIGTAKIEQTLPIRQSTIPINNAKPNPYN